ncbi:sigma-70 family RNA polymerase sigma factor [Jatrophihabitans cynanchi]|jgi:RNA polymerase sigma-70 factor (ECF subfamily)|uniref:Sigma-70 family RNA polymerase sigma factor n=1 Tax=Jatrophihabitans cynanchi TaxID=2944128 RepID=A0ABY7JXG0_9ACTN|nr:sigma-70 family RNA polymerase sigma factor [Jatrophihabitans sp. SB3-54]WAX57249.1 sigma-70 family RNA polymerase sigma factor [Jatrophihabitans sp. SB3-54]
MGEADTAAGGDARAALLAAYDAALPEVYGYLLARCGRREVAEELTSETFLAAADAVRRTPPPRVAVPWLIGVARHKLVDHWRREARELRNLHAVAGEPEPAEVAPGDPEHLDALRSQQTLAALAPQHRLALTLRYVDDLPVARVAELLGRTPGATEALLTRAKQAFRAAYCTASGAAPGETGKGGERRG